MINQIEMMNYLEVLRKKAKMTIATLLDGIIPTRQYSRYLSGSAEIPLQTLSEILERLHLTLFEFSAYHTNHIIANNYDEVEFWLLVQSELYEQAYRNNYPSLVNKVFKSHIASQAMPLCIKLVEYKNKKISLVSAREEMKRIIQLGDLVNQQFLTDNDIISIYVYVQICDDVDKDQMIALMIRILDKGMKNFLVTNIEELLSIFYIALLYALTTKSFISIQDRCLIRRVTSEFIEYHSRSKLANYDVKFFGVLYKYIKKYNINNPHIIYYYIASILSSFGDVCVEGSCYQLCQEDMELYLSWIQDDSFTNSRMYEGVTTDDL
jgi:hypothetical protein